MKIAIGSDHAGFRLKEIIKNFLKTKGVDVEDFGTYTEESVDYPDYAFKVGEAVSKGDFDFGILICGTGVGMSISANKVKGIRASLCNDLYTAHASREHNNANILCMGGRVVGDEVAKEIVDVWLSSKFEGGRHERRINKIRDYENS
ncbi:MULTISPECIES: ribose 5-phosphate isomerase B [Caldisericum]|jgi:ribose 5-phosphate isomerase B|uniref:Ribose 5-phosphate isomerase B n=1 Tax=Caldisericum exile TaxID=693075 RepID=A0A2J6X6F7_9BACT|nr:MAG: ribose 5-phosphate isomerase B [Caldisericum exile]PMP82405.1 MAG: ribose 5-phosphate isomerase B [Caldisericum exile]